MNRHSVQRQRIGPAVRRLRRSRGLTLDELADEAEVSPSHLSRLERSQTLPSFPVLAKIADALGVDVNEFVRLEQDVAEIDRKLSVFAGLLALDDDSRHELLNLSIEARRDIVERLEELAGMSLTPPSVQDRATRAVDSGRDEAPLSAVGTIIEQDGMDAIGLTRMRFTLELLNGERRTLIAGPSLIPVQRGQDLLGAYRRAFPRYPIDPSIALWWSRENGSGGRNGEPEKSSRIIVTTAALDSPLGAATARSLLSGFESAHVAIIKRPAGDVNMFSVSSGYAMFERISARQGPFRPEHVALWLSGTNRVAAGDELFDRLWESLSDEERDQGSVRERLRGVASQSG